jgi:hypothetical protein
VGENILDASYKRKTSTFRHTQPTSNMPRNGTI